mgnify:CR=1 FL=1
MLCTVRSLKNVFTIIIVMGILVTSIVSVEYTSSARLFMMESNQEQRSNHLFVDQQNNQGPWTGSADHPFQMISQALSKADPCTTIFIKDGVYHEIIEIVFPISLVGMGSPVIDGNYRQNVISIRSSDVSIENLTVIHSDGGNTDAGVYIDQSNNVSINNCTIHHTRTGVFANYSKLVLIKNSSFFHSGNAIRTDFSTDISIQGCDFARNSMAILTQHSTQISLNFSIFYANGMSGFFHRSSNISIVQCNLTDNSVNKGGLFFSASQFIDLKQNLFRHNGVGVSISNVSSVHITHCDFVKNTHFAISLRDASEQVMISNCSIRDGIRSGVYIESDNSCTLTRCHLQNNYLYSIFVKPGSDCMAMGNWWNSSLGPWYGFITKTNKVNLFHKDIIVYPWEKTPFKEIGCAQPLPSPRYNHTFDEQILISCDEVDTDNDYVADWWEEKYGYDSSCWDDHRRMDADGDGLSNVQEYFTADYGSDPFQKDIFLELDWMHCENGQSNKPEKTWLQPIMDSYAARNITLHIDLGSLGGGEKIFHACDDVPTYAALGELYWTYFLENDLQNPRKNIFHYGLLCNFCPDLNFPFMGWNALDSFAISVEWLTQQFPFYERQQLITGGIAHHLGHTLGLIADTYQGIDNTDTVRLSSNWLMFRNYRSCMNYLYKYKKFTLSDGLNGSGDFNDWEHLDFKYFQKGLFEEQLAIVNQRI